MKRFFVSIFLPIWIFAESNPTNYLDKYANWEYGGQVYLVTTPKSGTHWLGHSLTSLSGHCILYAGENPNRTEAIYNPEFPPIIQRHIIDLNSINIQGENKLIFLTRNYLDSLLRLFENPETIINFLSKQVRAKRMYPEDFCFPLFYNKVVEEKCGEKISSWAFLYEQFYIYDAWKDDKKMLLSYEELISNPKEVFETIMLFLNEKEWKIDEYIDHLSMHQQIARSLYTELPFGNCKSDGSTLNAYSKNLSSSQIDEINSLLEEIDPYLYAKYIKPSSTQNQF